MVSGWLPEDIKELLWAGDQRGHVEGSTFCGAEKGNSCLAVGCSVVTEVAFDYDNTGGGAGRHMFVFQG